jgi:recombination protein RecT
VVQQLCGWRVAQVYNDVPERMWPVAKRSLMAHVARIESMVS